MSGISPFSFVKFTGSKITSLPRVDDITLEFNNCDIHYVKSSDEDEINMFAANGGRCFKSHKLCEHCVSFFTRNDIDIKTKETKRKLLENIMKIESSIPCFGLVHPMDITNIVDSMLENNEVLYNEAINFMKDLRMMYMDVYVRSQPTTEDLEIKYYNTMKELRENDIEIGPIIKSRYHMTQREINKIAKFIGKDIEIYITMTDNIMCSYEEEYMDSCFDDCLEKLENLNQHL